MIGRRAFLRGTTAAAAAVGVGAPAILRAQGKGKVRLAYLQLGWAATEIIHKEDLLGKRGWSAEYSVIPGAPRTSSKGWRAWTGGSSRWATSTGSAAGRSSQRS